MSTPQYCPGCGNRCSLSSPSCSTGEAYGRTLRQARHKAAAAKTEETAAHALSQAAPRPVPEVSAPVHPSPRGTPPRRPKAPASAPVSNAPRSAPEAPQALYDALSREDRLALQLHQLSRRMARNQPREKSGQGRILALLEQRGETSQRELMALTGVRSSSLSELLGKLEGAGLIQRTPCPSDLRTTLVSLTPAGRQKAAGIRTAARRSPFQALDAAEQAQLLALLEKLNRPD